jgi:DNA-directed RNA polymerase I subunit RPA1
MYTDEEVRAMSVVEVTAPVAFDALGTPLPHGLYDPLLGPAESKGNALCPTCSNLYLHCPGHSGHIELCVPVYHPLTFNKLISLLRIKCLACHNFRLEQEQVLKFAAKIHLMDIGRYPEALALDDNLAAKIHHAVQQQQVADAREQQKDKSSNSRAKKNSKDTTTLQPVTRAANQAMHQFLTQQLQIPPNASVVLNAHERVLRKQMIKDFLSDCIKCKKCNNCGAYSPKIRQDAFNKIFQTPLTDKFKKLNLADNIHILPASSTSKRREGGTKTEEDRLDETDQTPISDDEAEEDNNNDDDNKSEISLNDILSGRKRQDATVVPKSKQKSNSSQKIQKVDEYMHALEVEAQVRLTWTLQPLVCSKVFGSAQIRSQPAIVDSTDTWALSNPWGIFFLRVISVPPSRFRPPMALGVLTVEHSQNHYLNKILTLNDRLRTFLAMIQGPGSNPATTAVTGTHPHTTLLDQENTQSKAVSTWIELQTTVNCFMDSSRDPNASASSEAPNGVRQLLEKKEGIFRKHMMGKRVNFACRSVISPDPYIGTNEIGIPLYFAKVLTYPTPVTTLNVTEMRNLVIRGPHNYPGASWVELPSGQRLELDKMQQQKREALAARLLSSNGIVKVGRQLRNGDMVLMNRQVRCFVEAFGYGELFYVQGCILVMHHSDEYD